MAARVHVFTGGGSGWRYSLHIRRTMARAITGAEVAVEESLASDYDAVLGGDDRAVGCHMTVCITTSVFPRETVERHLLAVDLLRHARRTMH